MSLTRKKFSPRFDSGIIPTAFLPWPGLADPEKVSVALKEWYEGDLAWIEIQCWPLPAGLERDQWIVRHLPLAPFLRPCLQAWHRSQSLPSSFRPKQRLSPDLMQRLTQLNDAQLPQAFLKLKAEGLLSPLRPLNRSTWPKDIPWETGRWCFLEWPKA
jgi:hypothetical protein